MLSAAVYLNTSGFDHGSCRNSLSGRSFCGHEQMGLWHRHVSRQDAALPLSSLHICTRCSLSSIQWLIPLKSKQPPGTSLVVLLTRCHIETLTQEPHLSGFGTSQSPGRDSSCIAALGKVCVMSSVYPSTSRVYHLCPYDQI